MPKSAADRLRSPGVYISYSHDSDAHCERVLALAQQLRADGVDAWLDRFEPAPAQGWPHWLREQIEAADFVVVVCSPNYRDRFEQRIDSGGAPTWEGLLASQLLYEGTRDYANIIPVIFDTDHGAVPLVLRPGTVHKLPGNYESLLRRLAGALAVTPRALGVPTTPSVEGAGMPAALSLGDQLTLLLDEKEEALLAGHDIRPLSKKIIQIRRLLRAGPTLSEGDILAERYRLAEIVGRGGFATVWKAFDRNRQCLVAVKVLHGQWTQDRTRGERMERGSRAMAGLIHPGVVPVLADYVTDGRYHFFVMGWMPGGDLRRAVLAGVLGREEALVAVRQAAEGLNEAHRRGFVHRDVNPGNIVLDEEGRGRISDFDLVRSLDTTGGTRTGGGMGTFAYAAPELLSNAATADERADIYGLGMTLIFCLTCKSPPPLVHRTHPEYLSTLSCSETLREAIRDAVAYDVEVRERFCARIVTAIDQELRECSVGATAIEVPQTGSVAQPPLRTEATSRAIVPQPALLIVVFLGLISALAVGVVWYSRPTSVRPVGGSLAASVHHAASSVWSTPAPDEGHLVERVQIGHDVEPKLSEGGDTAEAEAGMLAAVEMEAEMLGMERSPPPGTVRGGPYLTTKASGGVSDWASAKKHCEQLGYAAFAGIAHWHLASPVELRNFIGIDLARSRYWTNARYDGQALIFKLPKGNSSMEKEDRKIGRPLCVAHY